MKSMVYDFKGVQTETVMAASLSANLNKNEPEGLIFFRTSLQDAYQKFIAGRFMSTT